MAEKKTGSSKKKTAAESPAEKHTKPAESAAVPEEAPAVPAEENSTSLPMPRRSVAFIGSECYPFVKTGGLGDVMYALPKALIKQNCDVKELFL